MTEAAAQDLSRRTMLENFVLFQLGWLACVAGAAADMALPGAFAAWLIIGWHLYRSARPLPALKLVLVTATIGLVWDSALVMSGWIGYPAGNWMNNAAPYWIVTLWMLFATTLNLSLRWLRDRFWLAAGFGLVGGPLAYYAGHRLGAVQFSDLPVALLAQAAGWAVLTPLLVKLGSRFDGFTATLASRREAPCLT